MNGGIERFLFTSLKVESPHKKCIKFLPITSIKCTCIGLQKM